MDKTILQTMSIFGQTERTDNWWIQPLLVFLGLSAFIIYTTWASFQATHYYFDGGGAHYLSPFYSPLLFGEAGSPRWFAALQPGWWPDWLFFSPAFLILAGPAGMRLTCYYYRGSYYKSFWADPPACAVGESRKVYRGEHTLPLIMHNAHRYFFYPAAIIVLILIHDAYRSAWFSLPDGSEEFGIGVGTIVLTVNALLLGGYTFGCHCARHLAGGRLNRLSTTTVQRGCFACVDALNKRHMNWAWYSLFWVGFTDAYVRLCATGLLTDWRIL